ncbi:intracellular sulfur oxidation DsrE/DsrF family protein [Agrobacterium vitis]|nr:intracellular sulfur oxidation DsrE/DsrF family protein [Agrobacterium vitis]MBE1436397.1 intracellular sulfur oxidation DsrE/DsrF family protein [Agrobacterium vitis]
MIHPLRSPSQHGLLRGWRPLALAVAAFSFLLTVAGWSYAAGAAATEAASKKSHHIAILIDSDDEKVMRHAIAYTVNLSRAYAEKDEPVSIEIVTNGSGIKLFRADTSPFQEPLAALRGAYADIVYTMCGSSHSLAEQKENKSIPLIEGARLVPYGISRIVELQEQGWTVIQG